MIRLTRLNRVPLIVNSDLIEHVENAPDTVVFMTTGQKYVVLESPEILIERIREYRRSIGSGWLNGIAAPERALLPTDAPLPDSAAAPLDAGAPRERA